MNNKVPTIPTTAIILVLLGKIVLLFSIYYIQPIYYKMQSIDVDLVYPFGTSVFIVLLLTDIFALCLYLSLKKSLLVYIFLFTTSSISLLLIVTFRSLNSFSLINLLWSIGVSYMDFIFLWLASFISQMGNKNLDA